MTITVEPPLRASLHVGEANIVETEVQHFTHVVVLTCLVVVVCANDTNSACFRSLQCCLLVHINGAWACVETRVCVHPPTHNDVFSAHCQQLNAGAPVLTLVMAAGLVWYVDSHHEETPFGGPPGKQPPQAFLEVRPSNICARTTVHMHTHVRTYVHARGHV